MSHLIQLQDRVTQECKSILHIISGDTLADPGGEKRECARNEVFSPASNKNHMNMLKSLEKNVIKLDSKISALPFAERPANSSRLTELLWEFSTEIAIAPSVSAFNTPSSSPNRSQLSSLSFSDHGVTRWTRLLSNILRAVSSLEFKSEPKTDMDTIVASKHPQTINQADEKSEADSKTTSTQQFDFLKLDFDFSTEQITPELHMFPTTFLGSEPQKNAFEENAQEFDLKIDLEAIQSPETSPKCIERNSDKPLSKAHSENTIVELSADTISLHDAKCQDDDFAQSKSDGDRIHSLEELLKDSLGGIRNELRAVRSLVKTSILSSRMKRFRLKRPITKTEPNGAEQCAQDACLPQESFTATPKNQKPSHTGRHSFESFGRAKLNRTLPALRSLTTTTLSTMDHLRGLTESLRLDVTSGTLLYAPQAIVDKLLLEAKSLLDATTQIEPQLSSGSTKKAWKEVWERELTRIVEEQNLICEAEEAAPKVMEEGKALMEVLHALSVITQVRQREERDRRAGNISSADGGEAILSDDMHGTRQQLVNEMKLLFSTSLDSATNNTGGVTEARLKAMDRNERVRYWEKLARKDTEFEKELRGVVEGHKLRDTGGVERVEEGRKEIEAWLLKLIYASHN